MTRRFGTGSNASPFGRYLQWIETVAVRDRLKASELLARSQGDFVEKRLLQLEGNAGLTLSR